VWEDVIDNSFDIVPRVRWFTGNDCYAEYIPSAKGICTAFIPDDQFWHNRVMIASNLSSGLFKIIRVHYKDDAPLPGAVATKEVLILRNYLHVWRVQVRYDNKSLDTLHESKKQDECNLFAEEYRKAHDGVSVSVVLGKTKVIRALMEAHGAHRLCESHEWQNNHIPRIKQEIAVQTADMRRPVEAVTSSLAAQIDSMTEAERAEIARKLGFVAAPAPAAAPSGAGLNAIVDIERMRELARRYGIRPGRKTLEALRAAIKDKVGGGTGEPDFEEVDGAEGIPPAGLPTDADPPEGMEEVEEAT